MSQAVGHFKGITLMAENGHFERPATQHSSDLVSSLLLASPSRRHPQSPTQSQDAKISSSDVQDSWILTTPEVDLSWMDPVEESCHYFEQRTPGSSVLRTATSVTFNYHNAQR